LADPQAFGNAAADAAIFVLPEIEVATVAQQFLDRCEFSIR
jgi:hypothetical protein